MLIFSRHISRHIWHKMLLLLHHIWNVNYVSIHILIFYLEHLSMLILLMKLLIRKIALAILVQLLLIKAFVFNLLIAHWVKMGGITVLIELRLVLLRVAECVKLTTGVHFVGTLLIEDRSVRCHILDSSWRQLLNVKTLRLNLLFSLTWIDTLYDKLNGLSVLVSFLDVLKIILEIFVTFLIVFDLIIYLIMRCLNLCIG